MKRNIFFLLALSLCLSISLFAQDKGYKVINDGPYIIYNADGSARVITVAEDSVTISDNSFRKLPKDFLVEVSDEHGRYHFSFPLHKVERPACRYEQPEKLFLMSDPHGNFECVVSLLKGNQVINDQLEWNYGKNHLVIIGDIFDRGRDVLPIFWLVYKLEAEAEKAGGHVSFVFGNHEPLVLMNDLRYTEKKYTRLAEQLGMKYPDLFAPNTELGHWLNTRNTIMQVGRNIIVHAGLSKQFYERGLTFEQVNETMPLGLYKRSKERKEAGDLVYFLFGNQGPIWYRGLVWDTPKHPAIPSDTLDLILQRFNADRIIVGHTIFAEPSPFYNQRVFSVNVDNAENREARRGRAYLFTQGRIFVANDGGVIKEIPQVR